MPEDFNYEYESIDEIARGEGFFIDDDENWLPLEYAEEYGVELGDIDEDALDLNDDDDDDDDYDDDGEDGEEDL